MYPNICNLIYNSPIPSPPFQYYEDEHFLLQHIHTLLLQQQEDNHLEVSGARIKTFSDNFSALECVNTFSDNFSGTESTIINNNNNNSNSVGELEMKVEGGTMNKKSNNVVGKKCWKKDRHSKIHTAHGPRDRRMRLSLDVARKFFDLQDMLGFDKASKTVDWLLVKSRAAIKDLKQQKNNDDISAAVVAAVSDQCEAVSGVLDQEFEPPGNKVLSDGGKENNNNKKGKAGRVRAAFNPMAKESRNKARERARERTKMKNMLGETTSSQACLHNVKTNNNDTPDHLMRTPPPQAVATAAPEELSSHIHEHNWNLSTIFQCHQNPSATSHEHEYADFPYSGKFWEGYNNGNL